MSEKFPCCICPLSICGGSTGCPFSNNDFPFEEKIQSMIEEEIPEEIPDIVEKLLLKNCRKMSEKEINLLISQIY